MFETNKKYTTEQDIERMSLSLKFELERIEDAKRDYYTNGKTRSDVWLFDMPDVWRYKRVIRKLKRRLKKENK